MGANLQMDSIQARLNKKIQVQARLKKEFRFLVQRLGKLKGSTGNFFSFLPKNNVVFFS